MYHRKHSSAVVTRVNQLNLNNVRPSRGGIVLYTVYQKRLYYGFCIDSRTHDLTDGGGTIDYKIDKTVLHGSIREFEEETVEIFEHITVEDIKWCPVVYDDKNLIIFMHIDVDPNEVSQKFNERYSILCEKQLQEAQRLGRKPRNPPEVCGITWLTHESLQQAIDNPGVLYSRVRKFLAQVITPNSEFLQLL